MLKASEAEAEIEAKQCETRDREEDASALTSLWFWSAAITGQLGVSEVQPALY